MKIKSFFNLITTLTLLLLILGLSVWLLISPKETFSEFENKVLAQTPAFSFTAIKDTSFMQNTETYITDHFPFRILFLQTKARSEIFQGKTEKNGVILAQEHYLIQDYSYANKENLDNVRFVINRFAQNNADMKVLTMVVPNAAAVNEEKMPRFYSGQDQQEVIKTLYASMPYTNNIAVCEQLKINNQKEAMFYRLDHHWTTMGAYIGYMEYCKATNIEYFSEESFNKEIISKDFYGTMSSKASIFFEQPDNIVRYNLKQEQQIKVQYLDNNQKLLSEMNSLYNDEYLEKKDQYSSFLNANQPLTIIKNSTVKNTNKLMIVKDSYANCLIPFLTNHYSEIYVVDLRYYDKPISTLMRTNQIDHCLILYSLVNLNTDTGIFALK